MESKTKRGAFFAMFVLAALLSVAHPKLSKRVNLKTKVGFYPTKEKLKRVINPNDNVYYNNQKVSNGKMFAILIVSIILSKIKLF